MTPKFKFAGLGESQAAAAFAKEGRSEIILQALHLQADSRRSTAKVFCCLRQSGKVVRNGKGAQCVEIEVDSRCHICRHWITTGGPEKSASVTNVDLNWRFQVESQFRSQNSARKGALEAGQSEASDALR
jgi:hypothetical protein